MGQDFSEKTQKHNQRAVNIAPNYIILFEGVVIVLLAYVERTEVAVFLCKDR